MDVDKIEATAEDVYEEAPAPADIDMLLEGYAFSFFSLDYKEAKIESIINKWLNDKKHLDSAKIIDKDTAIDLVPDVRSLIE